MKRIRPRSNDSPKMEERRKNNERSIVEGQFDDASSSSPEYGNKDIYSPEKKRSKVAHDVEKMHESPNDDEVKPNLISFEERTLPNNDSLEESTATAASPKSRITVSTSFEPEYTNVSQSQTAPSMVPQAAASMRSHYHEQWQNYQEQQHYQQQHQRQYQKLPSQYDPQDQHNYAHHKLPSPLKFHEHQHYQQQQFPSPQDYQKTPSPFPTDHPAFIFGNSPTNRSHWHPYDNRGPIQGYEMSHPAVGNMDMRAQMLPLHASQQQTHMGRDHHFATRRISPRSQMEQSTDIDRKPQQLKDIDEAAITPDDVLCGRGGGTNRHNVKFRQLVSDAQPQYIQSTKKEKTQIAKSIVATVRSRGGRFLKLSDNNSGYYYDVGDKNATAKTSQALREGLSGRMREIVSGSGIAGKNVRSM